MTALILKTIQNNLPKSTAEAVDLVHSAVNLLSIEDISSQPVQNKQNLRWAIEDSPLIADKLLSPHCNYVYKVEDGNMVGFLRRYRDARLAGHNIELLVDCDLGKNANGWDGAMVVQALRLLEKEYKLSPAFIYPNSSDQSDRAKIAKAAGTHFADDHAQWTGKLYYVLPTTPAAQRTGTTPGLFSPKPQLQPEQPVFSTPKPTAPKIK